MKRRLPTLPARRSPPTYGAPDSEARRRTRERILCELGAERASPSRISEVVRDVYRALDEALEAEEKPIACGPGCFFCCHVHVDATPPEVIALAEHLERERGRGALAELARKLAARVALDLSDEARWQRKVPCALLDAAGRCSAHEARPLACRRVHSRSSEPCRDAYAGGPSEGPLSHASLDEAAQAIEMGMDEGFVWAGYEMRPATLDHALLARLSEPASALPWLRRERGFSWPR